MSSDPKGLKSVKALFFDVFGTVVDWRASIISALEAEAKEGVIGSSKAPTDWPAFASAWREAYMRYCKAVATGQTAAGSIEQHFRSSLVQLLQESGLSGLFTDEQLDRLAGAWGRLDGWPDSAAGLTQLQSLGLRTCTLSNGSRRLLGSMAQHSNLSWTQVYSSEDFGSFKPDPRVYQGAIAAEKLPANETAMVAAHLRDLAAAHKQGMRCIYIERKDEEDLSVEDAAKVREEVVDLLISVDEDGIEAVARALQSIRDA